MTEAEYREETLTREAVSFQLDQHGVIDHAEFFNDVEHDAPFTGEEVLDWLGY